MESGNLGLVPLSDCAAGTGRFEGMDWTGWMVRDGRERSEGGETMHGRFRAGCSAVGKGANGDGIAGNEIWRKAELWIDWSRTEMNRLAAPRFEWSRRKQGK